MAKTITISESLERDIVNFCEDELNYHINESRCADAYDTEIRTQIKLLKLLGYEQMAEGYLNDYEAWRKENL